MTTEPVVQERRVADAIIDALAEGGVEVVLGMPGGLTGPLWTAMFEHPRVRALQVREEAIGSYMAEAYGRLTGRPLVVMGQGEWIVGNAGQGYLEALLGSSPLVILTEMSDGGSLSHHAPYQSGTGDYGTWDARTALAGVTKRVMVSHDPAQAVQHTQLAIKHAVTGAPGPVAVVFHSSSLRGTIGPDSKPRIYPTSSYLPGPNRAVDPDAVARAVAALRGARRPVVLAGNGVRVGGASAALAHLAEALDVPVATTAGGKGVFVETDARAVGPIGPYGWATANTLVGQADVVLAVGTRLAPSDTVDEHVDLLDPSRQTMVQIDVEPLNVAWTYPVDHPLVGDAGVLLDALREAYLAGGPPGHEAATDRVAAVFDAHSRFGSPEASSDEVPFTPQRVIGLLGEVLGDDTIISCDAGENRLFMMQWHRTTSAPDYLQPAAGGGMGYAVPAAMGAKLAHPDRPVVAVCGDGGFAMSIHALMTAVQEDLPIGVVVFNNGALGWVLHGMGSRAVAANFSQFDHAAIARSIGCEALRVASVDELRDGLKRCTSAGVPFVLDVPMSLATSFQDVASDLNPRRRKKTGY